MNIVPRLILWLYALAVGLVSVFVLVICSGWLTVGEVDSLIPPRDAMAAGAVIILLVSLFFLFYRSKTRDKTPQTITHRLEQGDVKISYQTLEQLVERAATRTRGVQNLKSRIQQGEHGMKIAIRYAIEADLDIPKTTEEIQKHVKEYVEQTAGIPVQDVTVYVTELSVPKDIVKKRVQ